VAAVPEAAFAEDSFQKLLKLAQVPKINGK
jgi:hypothetical protein